MRIVIIPARGGSKGIKGKNLKQVGGLTLVERAIKVAKSINPELIILSTDSSEIRNLGIKEEITTLARSSETASDNASTESVVMEVLNSLEKPWSKVDVAGIIQPTSPFIDSETLADCLSLAESGYSAFSAVQNHIHLWSESNGNWMPVNHPANKRIRRQDRPSEVRETGAVYAFPIIQFLKHQYRFCSPPRPVIVSEVDQIEIDSPLDLWIAQKLAGFNPESKRALHLSNLRKPKLFVTDFDGCLTDDTVCTDEIGVESVICSRKDGLAVQRFIDAGVETLILSSEKNMAVKKRAEKIGINIVYGVSDKVKTLENILISKSISWGDIWYCGNDLNDLKLIQIAGLGICPSDAVDEIKSCADLILETKGGAGILPEVIRLVEVIK